MDGILFTHLMTVVIIASGSGDEYGPSGANSVVVAAAAAIDPQTLDSIRRKPYGVSNSVRNHKWQEEQSNGEEGSGGGAAHRDESNGERKRLDWETAMKGPFIGS